jgi:hypothetical protein
MVGWFFCDEKCLLRLHRLHFKLSKISSHCPRPGLGGSEHARAQPSGHRVRTGVHAARGAGAGSSMPGLWPWAHEHRGGQWPDWMRSNHTLGAGVCAALAPGARPARNRGDLRKGCERHPIRQQILQMGMVGGTQAGHNGCNGRDVLINSLWPNN